MHAERSFAERLQSLDEFGYGAELFTRQEDAKYCAVGNKSQTYVSARTVLSTQSAKLEALPTVQD
jgi:hypothetical protein